MMQWKDTMNKKQSLLSWCWCHGPVLFLHQFLWFFLSLLLHHSGKLAIPHNHLLLLLHILHLVLFKYLQRQANLSISGDIRIVFWWDRDDNRAYHLWGDLIYHLFGTDLLRYIFDRQFQKIYSFWCKNATRIVFLSVAGRNPSLMDGFIWVACHWPCRWVDGM